MTARLYSPAILAAERRVDDARRDLHANVARGCAPDTWELALSDAQRELDLLILAASRRGGRRHLPPDARRLPLAISLSPRERAQLEAAADDAMEPLAVFIRTAALARAGR